MSVYIHGDNIEQKLKNEKSAVNQKYLKEIKSRYLKWRQQLNLLKGRNDEAAIIQRVDDLNAYKDFIDQPKFRKEQGNLAGFTSQSKLHSTVLEEFMYHLLVEVSALAGKQLEYGPTNAYSNLYFAPRDLNSFEVDSGLIINTKDQDFAISKKIDIWTRLPGCKDEQQRIISVPVVSIECKTYLDKTMYEGSVATAEKIKRGNPYSKFLIVTETYEVAMGVDPVYSAIDQIYVLRKLSKRGLDNRQPIHTDIVIDLCRYVEHHLTAEWRNVEDRVANGKLI